MFLLIHNKVLQSSGIKPWRKSTKSSPEMIREEVTKGWKQKRKKLVFPMATLNAKQ